MKQQCFQYIFIPFSMSIFIQNIRRSCHFLARLTNREEASSLQQRRNIYIISLFVSFHLFQYLFWIVQLNAPVIGATTAVRPQIFLSKNRKRTHFLKRLPQIKNFVSRSPHSKIWIQPQTASHIHGSHIMTLEQGNLWLERTI